MKNYKIYFNEKPFYIVSELSDETRNLSTATDGIFLENATDNQVKKSIEDIEIGTVKSVVILTEVLENTLKLFTDHFLIIEAGGGLVKNEKDEFLFIFRRGKWDLPKGKLDEGETIDECAIREVQEETGLKAVSIVNSLPNTYHIYEEKGKQILKKSVWYLMITSSGETLVPQAEEQISEVVWLKKENWGKVLANTYPSVMDVLSESGLS